MREILFRGKTTDRGEWVQGCYIETLRYNNLHWIWNGKNHFTVNPETIGQYTGLTDKNGKKIFEGDVVKLTDAIFDLETTAYIEFGNPNGLYNWGWQLKPLQSESFAVEILHWVGMEETGAFIEVIGNIHDNPELLGNK